MNCCFLSVFITLHSSFFIKLKYGFSLQSTLIEGATIPYRTAQTTANAKRKEWTMREWVSTKWTKMEWVSTKYHKEQGFATKNLLFENFVSTQTVGTFRQSDGRFKIFDIFSEKTFSFTFSLKFLIPEKPIC